MPPGEFRLQFDPDRQRILRGCSWFYSAEIARAAARNGFSPGNCRSYLGLRLCRDADHLEHTQRSEHAQEV